MKITPSEYQKLAARTESKQQGLLDHKPFRLLHAGMGMATESAEFLDVLKKYLYYNKSIDEINLQEEIGDLCWYIALACNAMGVDMDRLMAQNIAKLKVRYPEKFTEECAIERDLIAERRALEDKAAESPENKWEFQGG